ncbi:MAG: type II toxin-antitoxin system PemK/MazF family toxin [Verrucomicrobiota bacterium]
MIQRNDVLFVELPPPLGGAGREQTGRRPAIAVQDELTHLPTVLVLPVTSQLEARRFPFTLRVEPTTANGLTRPSIILLFQMQVIDKRRVVRVIGKLEPEYADQLDVMMRRMLKL